MLKIQNESYTNNKDKLNITKEEYMKKFWENFEIISYLNND